MFRRKRQYIVLQEFILPEEQRALEIAIRHILAPVDPSERFVTELERSLLAEMERLLLRALPLSLRQVAVGGALLGGLAAWFFWRRYRAEAPPLAPAMAEKATPVVATAH